MPGDDKAVLIQIKHSNWCKVYQRAESQNQRRAVLTDSKFRLAKERMHDRDVGVTKPA